MLSDREIKEYQLNAHMIQPFCGESVKSEHGKKVVSYGLSCAGYDLRIAEVHMIWRNQVQACKLAEDGRPVWVEAVDPKTPAVTSKLYDHMGVVVLEPHSAFIASTIEYIKMPRDLVAWAMIKSTYARCGLSITAPLIEPGWEGNLTITFANTSNREVLLYLNEGFCQIVFDRVDNIDKDYSEHGGRYQATKGVATARVQ